MASRLTVIISQSAVRQGHFAEIEESLLTELMLAARMDATLIGPLGSVEVASTDYLCLSGFAQSIALVSGLSTGEVAEQWHRLQLAGQVVPLGPAAQVEAGRLPPGRRVYHLPLQLGTQPILAQLRRLLADRAVQTVNVSLPRAKPLGTSAAVPQQTTEVPGGQRKGPGPTLLAGSQAIQPSAEAAGRVDVEWPDLDRLVDDFDSLDI